MEFHALPHLATEMDHGELYISKHDHFYLDSTAKDKLCSKACSALKTMFQHLDYVKLLNGASPADLGKMLLSHRTTTTSWEKCTALYDTWSIFFMPDLNNFSDPPHVANAPKIVLLTDYKKAYPRCVWSGKRL